MLTWVCTPLRAQVTTTGFLNQARPEAPGTLLSAPWQNGSQNLGLPSFVLLQILGLQGPLVVEKPARRVSRKAPRRLKVVR